MHGFVQDALQRNCFDTIEWYSNEIKTLSCSAVAFSFVLKYVTFSAILSLLFS